MKHLSHIFISIFMIFPCIKGAELVAFSKGALITTAALGALRAEATIASATTDQASYVTNVAKACISPNTSSWLHQDAPQKINDEVAATNNFFCYWGLLISYLASLALRSGNLEKDFPQWLHNKWTFGGIIASTAGLSILSGLTAHKADDKNAPLLFALLPALGAVELIGYALPASSF